MRATASAGEASRDRTRPAGLSIPRDLSLRAARLSSLLGVASLAWGSWALLYAIEGRWQTGLVDTVMTGATLALRGWSGAEEPSARRVNRASHGMALVSTLGMTADACLSGRSSSMVIWYLAAIPLFAAYLVGITATLVWGAIAVIAMMLIHVSERFWEIIPEFVPHGNELLLGRIGLVAVLIGFALVARTVSDDQVAEVEKSVETIAEQASELSRARDEALDASKVKSAFLANMSHEIRTPLNGVLGTTSLLLSTSIDAEQRVLLETIRSSGTALLGILNDVLDLSKIEAGKMSVEPRPTELEARCHETISLFAADAVTKGLTLSLSVAPEVPRRVNVDPLRLRQVLSNLVGNAVKFTRKGAIQVKVTRSSTPGSVRFAVIDTGPGLPKEKAEQLFQAFTQVDDSTTRKHGGTGLGLAICKHLVELMGGEIRVESEPGVGSTFSFDLPLDEVTTGEIQRTPVAVLLDPAFSSAHPLEILLAEDNPINELVATRMLSKLGYQITVARNGVEALERATEKAYDVVLMDVQMPEMDGLEASEAIRKALADGRQPRIVAMTANAAREDEQRCRDAGMDDFVTKPIDPGELMSALRRAARPLADRALSRDGSSRGRGEEADPREG